MKKSYAFMLAVATVVMVPSMAFAAADSSVVTLSTSAATAIKDTAIAVITALIPLAVGVFLAKKALPLAKRFLRV